MIGELIRRLRSTRGMSQTDLAAASGIDQPNISAIENGRRMPTAATARALVEACGFELAAVAGDQIVYATADTAAGAPSHRPTVLSTDERRRAVVAALDVAESIVRSR